MLAGSSMAPSALLSGDGSYSFQSLLLLVSLDQDVSNLVLVSPLM